MRAIPRHRTTALLCGGLAGALACWQAGAVGGGASEPSADELTQPQSRVEAGVGGVDSSSYKFGEYNAEQSRGLYVLGNFDLRGGGKYDSSDATRWRLQGSDLGLDDRSLRGEYGQQGLFRFTASFDELRHNLSDTYSTPYLGVAPNGTGNVLTLPAGWMVPLVPRLSGTAPNARGLSPDVTASNGLVAGVPTPPTAGQLATAAAIQAADLQDFRSVDLFTIRRKSSLGVSVFLTPRTEFSASFSQENRNGLKPMGSITATTGGDISAILPDPIHQTTNQVNAGLAYHGAKGFIQATFYGSIFSNDIKSLTWTNWAQPAATMTMSSAPDNRFEQFGVNGSYAFTNSTRLVATAAYGRNTQNESLLRDPTTVLVPISAFDGLVVTKAANLRLTSRATRALNVVVNYKHDDRQNQSPVNIFGFSDVNVAITGGSGNPYFAQAVGLDPAVFGSNVNLNATRSYSRKLDEGSVEGDLRVADGQALKASAGLQQIDRNCPGSWIDCADASRTREGTFRLEWRADLGESVTTHVNLLHARRTADHYNENAFLAIVPMANVSALGPGFPSAYAYMLQNGWTGYGPVAGYANTTADPLMNAYFPSNSALANAAYANQNRISELIGMRRYYVADRDRNKGEAYLDWQASDAVSLTAKLAATRDHYTDAVYGMQEMKGLSADVDLAYQAGENLKLSAFATFEDMKQASAGNSYAANSNAAAVSGQTVVSGGCFATVQTKNNNAKLDPCLNWSAAMDDKVTTLGAALDRLNLFGSRVDLHVDALYSLAQGHNDVVGGNYVNNPLAAASPAGTTVGAYYIPATSLPLLTTEMLQARLVGSYRVSRAAAWRLGYLYSKLRATDYAYSGLQFGSLSGVLPSGQQAPKYVVQSIALSYTRLF
ncbi:MAG: MtrB/PioB family outer membrane beta-barrel protein [Proteobacteria bacterium]|nr:MtrB/PioB family outer membrane beta-barrel protein [Pseudomonadota bacterium]